MSIPGPERSFFPRMYPNRMTQRIANRQKETKTLINRALNERSLFRPELKYYDTIQGATAITRAGTQTNLVYLIAEGVDNQERIGDKIKVVGIQIQYYMFPSSGIGGQDLITTYLIQDHQYNGVAPTIIGEENTDGTAVFNGNTAADPYGGLINPNLDQKKRFKILKKRSKSIVGMPYYDAGTLNVAEENQPYTYGKINIKCKKRPITVSYTASTGAVTDVSTNALLFGMSSSANGTSTYLFYARVLYVDM